MIRDLIESGADDYEIRKAIDENIAGARGYATSLGLINEASNVRPIGVFQFIFPQSAKLTQISGILSIVLH